MAILEQASSLHHMLTMIWESPVFGNAYQVPSTLDSDSLSKRVKEVHESLVRHMLPIVQEGLVERQKKDVHEAVQEVALKTTAFASAIGTEALDTPEYLAKGAVIIALIYWADQFMDRGDADMVSAVRELASEIGTKSLSDDEGEVPFLPDARLTTAGKARLRALKNIERIAHEIADEDDAPYLVKCANFDTSANGSIVCQLSRFYRREKQAGAEEEFWARYTDRIAECMVANVGIPLTTNMVYSVYRKKDPELPSLVEIYRQAELIEVLQHPANAALRVFDDIGDIEMDWGHDPRFGQFYLNIFNQPHPKLVEAFLREAHVQEEMTAEELRGLLSDPEKHRQVIRFFVDLVKERFDRIPGSLRERYHVYLMLAKRVVEGGYVNMIGDIDMVTNIIGESTSGAH